MSRLKQHLRNLRGSFWFTPSLIVAGNIVLAVSDDLPSRSGLEANAHALARYAALCQEAIVVPVVEPKVLMEGGHCAAPAGAVANAGIDYLDVAQALVRRSETRRTGHWQTTTPGKEGKTTS